ncbi:MAG: hypothetical protein SFZ24_08555 [Planctomycetota bacterium]|nr:hypothetical protein [Planctomycetota bacterium]
MKNTLAPIMILAAAGFAHAGMISEQASVTVGNDEAPEVFYRSILIFPVDQQGNPLTDATFELDYVPGVFVGDETSNIARPLVSSRFLSYEGAPGNQLLEFTFDDSAPWAPGELLNFRFMLTYEPTSPIKLDVQITSVPAPAALALTASVGLVAGLRRRR